MIVRKLRDRRYWSQEQLAEMSGLSIRTVQRVERGHSASLETLKSLASVFEVPIETLTEEITMIDKTTSTWKAEPLWIRVGFWGVRSRRVMLWIEGAMVTVGLAFIFLPVAHEMAPGFLLAAYATAWFVRYGDNKGHW